MFTLLVAALTGVVVLFVIVWLLRPGFRRWIEAPKYRMLEQERRFSTEAPPRDP